jgi:hypothetical protein
MGWLGDGGALPFSDECLEPLPTWNVGRGMWSDGSVIRGDFLWSDVSDAMLLSAAAPVSARLVSPCQPMREFLNTRSENESDQVK